MHDQTVSKTLVLLLAICCLVPLAALAAVLYFAAPVWLVALAGLLALVLLARRLMRMLAPNDGLGPSHDLPAPRKLSTHDHATTTAIPSGAEPGAAQMTGRGDAARH